ncbi:protein CUSTOS [Periplaneta americana]|uniref:protein CUSTOS n=1 Tax=Periplaneta americana TaxID=6978 RepID=UPI0037E7DE7B
MSESDTSSEENSDLLKEAADAQFLNDSLFTSQRNQGSDIEHNEIKEEKKPSLRPQLDKERQYNDLHVTPEFQSFIAKHLTKIIDRQLVEYNTDLSSLQNGNFSQSDGGVRLFGCSSSYLCAETNPSYKRKKRKVQKEDENEELEKCKEVSVSPDWILSKEETIAWVKSHRGEVLTVNESGDVISHVRAKKKIKCNSYGVRDDSFHININSSTENLRSIKDKSKRKEKRRKLKDKKRHEKMMNGNVKG